MLSIARKAAAALGAVAVVVGLASIASPALAEGDGDAQSGVVVSSTQNESTSAEDSSPEVVEEPPAAEPLAEPTTLDDNETANEDRPPKPEGDWYWSHGIFWDTCGGIAPSGPGYPGVNDGGISYPEGYYSRTLVVEAPYIWSDDAGDWVADLDNLITDSDTGYVRVRDLTNQERTELGCSSEPEVTTIPSFSFPTEVDDTTWDPTLPDGVAIDSDTGWKDGARVITVAPKDGYAFTDGQQTEFTVTVKEVTPVEPTAPVEKPSAAPVSPSQGNDKAKSDDSSSTTKAAESSKGSRGVGANTGIVEDGGGEITPLLAGFAAFAAVAVTGGWLLRRRSS